MGQRKRRAACESARVYWTSVARRASATARWAGEDSEAGPQVCHSKWPGPGAKTRIVIPGVFRSQELPAVREQGPARARGACATRPRGAQGLQPKGGPTVRPRSAFLARRDAAGARSGKFAGMKGHVKERCGRPCAPLGARGCPPRRGRPFSAENRKCESAAGIAHSRGIPSGKTHGALEGWNSVLILA